MDKTAYQNALAFLSSSTNLQAKPEILSQLCPHLTAAEIATIIKKGKRTSSGYYFALPPLLVDDVVGVAYIQPACTIEGKRHSAEIRFAFSEKMKVDGIPYATRALRYARRHWGNTLLSIKPVAVVRIHLQEPSAKVGTQATTKSVVQFTLSRSWQAICDDGSQPRSSLINSGIGEITNMDSVGSELTCASEKIIDLWFTCARCGGKLCKTGCSPEDCGYRTSDYQGRGTPLPEKVVAYLLQHGHSFAVDPALSRRLEAENWSHEMKKREQANAEATIAELQRQLAELQPIVSKSYGTESAAKATIEDVSETMKTASATAKLEAEAQQKRTALQRLSGNRQLAQLRKEAAANKSKSRKAALKATSKKARKNSK